MIRQRTRFRWFVAAHYVMAWTVSWVIANLTEIPGRTNWPLFFFVGIAMSYVVRDMAVKS